MEKKVQPWDKGTLTLLIIVSFVFFPVGLIIACLNQKHELREFQCKMILKFIGVEVTISIGSIIMLLCGSTSLMFCGWGAQIIFLGFMVAAVQSECVTYWTQELVMLWQKERQNYNNDA